MRQTAGDAHLVGVSSKAAGGTRSAPMVPKEIRFPSSRLTISVSGGKPVAETANHFSGTGLLTDCHSRPVRVDASISSRRSRNPPLQTSWEPKRRKPVARLSQRVKRSG